MKVIALVQTSEACPSQWEGRTEDNRPVYVWFRWGHLSVKVGPAGGTIMEAADGEEIYEETFPDEHSDGVLTMEELMERLCKIDWEEVCRDKEWER